MLISKTMAFSDIIGQDRAAAILQNAIRKRRVAGAYLFDGHSGCGKRRTALQFAKALNCGGADGGADACDKCASCRKIEDKNHMDISWIEPERESGSVKIEQIRQLQAQISLKPYEAAYKVFCILDADTMTHEAQNALLKTLEEPPARSIIILTSSNSRRLFRTIVSRCQQVRFLNLNAESMRQILKKAFGVTDEAARYFAFLSQSDASWSFQDGRGRARDILEFKNAVLDGFFAFIEDPSKEPGLFKEKKDAVLRALGIILWWFRDLLVIKERGLSSQTANADRAEQLKLQAENYPVSFIMGVIKAVLNAADAINERCNPKLALGVMFSEIFKKRCKNIMRCDKIS